MEKVAELLVFPKVTRVQRTIYKICIYPADFVINFQTFVNTFRSAF